MLEPKVLNVLLRRYIPLEQLDRSIAFYEGVFGRKAHLRFKYEQFHLEIAQVANVLLVAGADSDLERFKSTYATFMVEGISELKTRLEELGATIIEQPKTVPTGMNMRVKHPDGMIVEYVEHTDGKAEDERPN